MFLQQILSKQFCKRTLNLTIYQLMMLLDSMVVLAKSQNLLTSKPEFT